MTDGNAPVARGYPDIVERLRLRADGKDTFSQHHGHGFQSLCKDAADEIEHLAADIAVKARLLTAQTKEIERLRTDAQQQPEPSHVSAGTIDNILSKLDQGAAHQGYPEGFGFSWTQLAREAATIIRRLRSEAERANRLLADAQKLVAEYQASTTAGAKADVAAHGLPGARGRGEPDLAGQVVRLRYAIIGYLEVFDRCGGSESVSPETFAVARQDLRDAVAFSSTHCPPLNKKSRCPACNLLNACSEPGCPNALSSTPRATGEG